MTTDDPSSRWVSRGRCDRRNYALSVRSLLNFAAIPSIPCKQLIQAPGIVRKEKERGRGTQWRLSPPEVLWCRRTGDGLCGRRGRAFDTLQRRRRSIAAEIIDDRPGRSIVLIVELPLVSCALHHFDIWAPRVVVGERVCRRQSQPRGESLAAFFGVVTTLGASNLELSSRASEKEQQVRIIYRNYYCHSPEAREYISCIRMLGRCYRGRWSIFSIAYIVALLGSYRPRRRMIMLW